MLHVKVVKPFGAYCPGETASFPEGEARLLISKKLVVEVPVEEAAPLAMNPDSEQLARERFDRQMAANDAAAAATARITGKTSHPSANGYEVAAGKAK